MSLLNPVKTLFIALMSLLMTPLFAGDSELDLIRLEGIYEIDATYTHLDGLDKSRLDRLVIFRNEVSKNFTIALAISKLDTPFIIFSDTNYQCEEGKITLRGEGELANGIYGEILLRFNRETLTVEGVMTDSIATGYKKFTGQALYNLDKCLYRGNITEFPKANDLTGEYIDEKGNLLLIRMYSSGAISAVMKKKLSDGDFQDIKYSKGSYIEKYGLLELHWKTPFFEGTSIEGKTNITYRIDDEQKPYLKLFTISTSGMTKPEAKKFYFRRKILDLPDL